MSEENENLEISKLKKDLGEYYNLSRDRFDQGLVLFEESFRQNAVSDIQSKSRKLPPGEPAKIGEALLALANANLAVTCGYHVGDGLGAFRAAKEALKNPDILGLASEIWLEEGFFSFPIRDVALNIRQWASGYDECIDYVRMFSKLYSDASQEEFIAKLQEDKKEGYPWWKMQLNFAYKYYNRESPQLDKGHLAPAMSILQCILIRMLDHNPGYELNQQDEYQTYLHLLDDYIILSYRYAKTLIEKNYKSCGSICPTVSGIGPDIYYSVCHVLKNPFFYWLNFLPNLLQKDYPILANYFDVYTLLFAPFEIKPEQMDKLDIYFKDRLINCIYCGKENAISFENCIFCGYSLKKKMSIFKKLLFKLF